MPCVEDYLDLNRYITYQEVKRAINRSKNVRVIGVNNIPNELLKHEAVINLLHEFFNHCVEKGCIPDTWRQSIIHPIPKGKAKTIDPLKYHGLALQCCIYKVFSSILNDRVVDWLDQSKLLTDEQNGFRKGRSCLHHIFTINTLVNNKCRTNKDGFFGAFVDFRKAFDSVDRPLLYHRLVNAGVDGKVLELIKQMYAHTSNILCINGLARVHQ